MNTVQDYRGESRYGEPMARHSSWRAGGPAKRFCIPADVEDLQLLLRSLPADEPLLWLGLGSNTLVRDGGFDGTVIATRGVCNTLKREAGNRVRAGAGVSDARLARFCAGERLVGGEFFAGIPGLLGGALAMNAGAFGGETWRHVVEVRTVDREGELRVRPAADFDVAYRKVDGPRGEWFVEALLQFESGDSEQAGAAIRNLLARRSETQPTGLASCGSVFRNPQGDYAARLIEACGLKGMRIGGAVVSEKHANFIINDGKASAHDIEMLIFKVQQRVERETGFVLQPEVHIVGVDVA